jgi:hypothetical protein
MPAAPIPGIFHARFASRKFVERIPLHGKKTTTPLPIKLREPVTDPVVLGRKLQADNRMQYWVRMPGTNSEVPLAGLEGSIVIGNRFNGDDPLTLTLDVHTDNVCGPAPKQAEGSSTENQALPTCTRLGAAYPNPFNPVTVIGYQLSANGHVSLKVYDVLGREIATLVDEYQSGGYRTARFNASDLPSGIYFYRLMAGGFVKTNKMIVLK